MVLNSKIMTSQFDDDNLDLNQQCHTSFKITRLANFQFLNLMPWLPADLFKSFLISSSFFFNIPVSSLKLLKHIRQHDL